MTISNIGIEIVVTLSYINKDLRAYINKDLHILTRSNEISILRYMQQYDIVSCLVYIIYIN